MLDFPIIAKLGGRKAVFEHLQRAGIVRTRRAFDQWFSRGRIPSPAQTELMQLAEARTIAYGASDFVQPADCGKDTAPAQEAAA